MKFIAINNWEEFQHYKDRDPPWVKLYRDLLTSESWVLGTDLSRVVQIASVLLAPRYGNKIPYRFDLLKKVMGLDCTEAQFSRAVDHLCSVNFFVIQSAPDTSEVVEQSASTPLSTCASEQSREDQSRSEKNPPTPQGGALAVFSHWQVEWEHPKAVLDGKRKRLIEARLQDFTPEQLCQSITGYRASQFHRGQNKDGKVFDALELFLRDSQHVEEGLRYLRAPPRPPPAAENISPGERVMRAYGGNGDGRVVAEQFGSGGGDVEEPFRRLRSALPS